MNLLQTKLTKAEWDNIDLLVSENEQDILNMIIAGFDNTDICVNKTNTLFSFLKMPFVNNMEIYLCNLYFVPLLTSLYDKMNAFKLLKKNKNNIHLIQEKIDKFKEMFDKMINVLKSNQKQEKVSSINILKIKNLSSKLDLNKKEIFEFILIDIIEKIWLFYLEEKSYLVEFYTLINILNNCITINSYLNIIIKDCIDYFTSVIPIDKIFFSSVECIEKNNNIFKYKNITLYPHQKQLFSILRNTSKRTIPKLILYIAPTGTGKTQSPIGLLKDYKIIYLCASRHVGLALAKCAVSCEKKTAFAFGCTTASDIRLHNSSCHTFTKNYKTGGIFKIDVGVGIKVEMMICDIQSYIIAMHYMLAWHDKSNIITMWDEPTISMDVNSHELHEMIHKNWSENVIETVILSCATLPTESEIQPVIQDFKNKFEGANIYMINTYDCQKSISILNKDSMRVIPHNLYLTYEEVIESVRYCEKNKSLLRYFDLSEILIYVELLQKFQYIPEEFSIQHYFKEIKNISMETIKLYYLDLIKLLTKEQFNTIKTYQDSKNKIGEPISRSITDTNIQKSNKIGNPLTRSSSTNSAPINIIHKGILLTTVDAHTLTDGPTIYLSENIEKIGQFYIHQSNIPDAITESILSRIHENNHILKTIQDLQRELETVLDREKDTTSEKQLSREQYSPAVRLIMQKIENTQTLIKPVSLEMKYIPNTVPHQLLWNNGTVINNAFVPNISEDIICKIMLIENVSIHDKLLLLLGIGVFKQHPTSGYMEIMKQLCIEQKLYIIIAHSDYIYGLNYQCCHGFIGKDLINMTHQKILQALGRVGRGNSQQTYTARFRDDNLIRKLFNLKEDNMEAIVMNRLFTTD